MTSENILKAQVSAIQHSAGKKEAQRFEKAYRAFCSSATTTDPLSIFKAGYEASMRRNKKKEQFGDK